MKFQILNNEELGFFDNNGDKKAILKLSGSDFILDPVDTGANIMMGQGETINDLELGIASTPINMTFLGGGTISSNAGTLYIGDGVNDDKVVLTGVTISSSVNFASGLTGSFQGSFTGDGSNITGITATTAPGGNNKTIQFNDNNTATGGDSNFTFDKTTDTVELTGSLNVSGSASADFFFGDGSGLTNIVGAFPFTGSAGVSGSIIVEGPVTASGFSGDGSGLTNVAGVFPFTGSAGISGSLDVNGNVTATAFYGNGANITGVTSIFAPTGQDKSLQFNKGGTEISGSGGLLFDYDNDSLYVAQAVTASEFTGHGSLNTPFIGDIEITGSAKITGSLNIDGDPIITGSLLIEKNSNTVAIGKGVVDGGYNNCTLVGVGARAYSYTGTAVGINTGVKTYGVSIGDYAAQNGGGNFSIAIGDTTHRFNTGDRNVAIGGIALLSGNGSHNVAIGMQSLEAGGTGTGNTALGAYSGRYITGDYNSYLGYEAGYYATGSKNVILGYQAGYNLTGSNQLIIANNSSSALISGDFDTGAVEFLGNSFKVGTSKPAGPVFEVADGSISVYATDLIIRPRNNSAYNLHYWGIIRWDPSGTNRGLRILSGDYTNSVQIGTGLSGSSTENIIANFTNSGVRIGDRSTPNADLDVNGTAIVSGSLEVKNTTTDTGATTFEIKNSNGATCFRVKDNGLVGIGLGSNGTFYIDDNGGDRTINVVNYDIVDPTYNFNITAGGTAISTNSDTQDVTINQVKFQRGSGVDTNTPNTQAWEIVMPGGAGHIKNYHVIRGFDYGSGQGSGGGPQMNIFAGSGSAGWGDLVLQHDFDQSRGNVGIGKEPNASFKLDVNGGLYFENYLRQKYYTDTNSQYIKMGSAYELFGTAHSAGGYIYHLYPEGWNSGWQFAIGDSSGKHSFSPSAYTSPGQINTTSIKMGSNLFSYETSPHTGLKYNNGNGWSFVIRGNDNTNKLTIDSNGNTSVSGSLTVGGSISGDGSNLTNIPVFPFTGSAIITGSLQVEGSGSTVFEVIGSEGQLFSITDSLSGSLFAVSDVSGLPILEVFSDDTIKMGSFNNEALEISGSDVNFNNLPTSDPGVAGRLYQTGSDAIGATAGFQVVCISQG